MEGENSDEGKGGSGVSHIKDTPADIGLLMKRRRWMRLKTNGASFILNQAVN
jgi:hypothetical protein